MEGWFAGVRVSIQAIMIIMTIYCLDLRPQLSLVGLEKVSIDTNYSPSIDTPFGSSIDATFSPSIDATTGLSIDVPSSKLYRAGLTCSLEDVAEDMLQLLILWFLLGMGLTLPKVGAHRWADRVASAKIMARPDSPSDDESPWTGGALTAAAFADTILERMAQQEVVKKATNEQLAAIAAILAPFAGNSGDPASTVRKQLFDTCRTAGAKNTMNTNAAQVQTPCGVDLVTVRELAELKQSFLDMKDRMLEGPTAAPLIERVLAETLKTPFSRRVTNVRAKHKSKKSNLVIVDVSKSSSHDQVHPQMKKRTNRSTTRTSTPASDQMRTSD
ncbi:hypothetical protein F2Q69_00006908 [Brassica cretica]|uniref:Uncharacterized protein n=1 Tax=Brassica cretica TaxID=69181 RepID=A0A8S9PD80_BRACR|nr:hypothetical protein F2Q69_00006908 [Brassica cretica]